MGEGKKDRSNGREREERTKKRRKGHINVVVPAGARDRDAVNQCHGYRGGHIASLNDHRTAAVARLWRGGL